MALGVKRRGSVLLICLIILGLLGGLAAIEGTRWLPLISGESDGELQIRLDNEARHRLESVSRWIVKNKPQGPAGGQKDVILSPLAGPEDLEAPLPADLADSVIGSVRVSARIQWCRFRPPSSLPPKADASEYPPSLLEDLQAQDSVFFSQSYASSGAGRAPAPRVARAAWRVLVTARPDSAQDDLRSVSLERIVVTDL